VKPILMAIVVAGLCGWLARAHAEEPPETADDDRFVASAAKSDSTELELGRLALQRAEQADLKAFAHQVIRDHAAASVELIALAGKKQIPVPRTVDAKQRDVIARLSRLTGGEFERAFTTQMVKDHKAAVDLFRSESEHGTDPDLKAYATKVLPVLEKNVRRARELTGDEPAEARTRPAAQ
jgi:putative membrane protein